MAKKLTIKQRKELKEKAALLQRVRDVYSGALGDSWPIAPDEVWATAEILSRVVPALRAIFGGQQEISDFVWSTSNINHFDNPDSAADFLFGYGFRAE